MASPVPIPTSLKILRGNPGQRKINKKEPSPSPGIPLMPQTLLDAESRAEWKRITGDIETMNIMTRVDGKALAFYCDSWSLYRHAVKAILKTGSTPHLHDVVSKNRNTCLLILQQFGLTPASRTKVTSLSGPSDALDDFLKSPSKKNTG